MIADRRQPEPPEWLKGYELLGIPQLSNRDAVCLVLPGLDYDAQLMAIRSLLRRHKEADRVLEEEIKSLKAKTRKLSGVGQECAISHLIDRYDASVYQGAAHSMAAVGMLAPLIESIFHQAFQGIRRCLRNDMTPPSTHARWEQPAEDQWDCHFAWNKGRRSANLVEGITQLADALGMSSYLPGDFKLTLQALFEYRNKMFHCGFEWPIDERERFQKRIKDAGWPSDWFARATTDDKPWVFYLTDMFIDHCLTTIDQTIKGIGAFCNKELLRDPRAGGAHEP